MSSIQPSFIVGIGGSAGALNAYMVFLDALPAVRAERRMEELRDKGLPVTETAVASEMAQRDQRDRSRVEAPLVQAPDAIYLDTSNLSIEEVEEAILKIIRSRVSNGKEVAH